MTVWETIKYKTIFKGVADKAEKTLSTFAYHGETGGDKNQVTLANLKKAFTDENVTKLFNNLGSSSEVCNLKDWIARGIVNCATDIPDDDMQEALTFLEKNPVVQATLSVSPNSNSTIKNIAQVTESAMGMIREKVEALTHS